ncbi:tRNA 2-thiocytidine biosynthesis TtcA family protein [Parachlamydia sp. AcF125]|uniref:tRNA lysidine(34) synthetase n=1 Tax=Parachlamydia sp. AcF125 TaxID=2795736 RepID=UPI001BCA4057|nr:tRNA 2-thiocytidine biosynthesis TtcA family protein [Parachlamydia sp. AcF125]MBS4168446.1 tRNA-cytidine(32) 2-sulfurtransferase [Parachlamydia sp. AcF125]
MLDLPLAQPPWTGLGKRLESMVRKALFKFQMIPDSPKMAIALSGGKDSLALLFLLKAISGRGFPPFELYAVHVHGAFSCGAGVNLNYLSSICARLEIPFLVRESNQTLETLECYSCSRERRRLLFEAAKSVGATTIAFGHHRDDNAQTLLMNLFHKAEFAGNLPKLHMREYGVTLIRPLIFIAEKEISAFAEQYGFKRITCRCPVGQHSMRRQVDQLLTQLEELFPHVRENIAQAGLLYGSDKANTP